jgi:hypothetical protein
MRTHAEIISSAQNGEARHLVFTFRSAHGGDRMEGIDDAIRRTPLEGLAVRVLLNPADAKRQRIPVEAEGRFRTWGADIAVPVGEFHLAISRGQ